MYGFSDVVNLIGKLTWYSVALVALQVAFFAGGPLFSDAIEHQQFGATYYKNQSKKTFTDSCSSYLDKTECAFIAIYWKFHSEHNVIAFCRNLPSNNPSFYKDINTPSHQHTSLCHSQDQTSHISLSHLFIIL